MFGNRSEDEKKVNAEGLSPVPEKKTTPVARDNKSAKSADKLIGKGDAARYCKLLGGILAGLDLKNRSVEKTGISGFVTKLDCVVLNSFEYGEISKMRCAIGADRKKGTAVSSNYSVTHLYFGSDRVFVYSFVFSAIGRYTREEVAEIRYRDITCIRTVRETVEIGYGVTETKKGKGTGKRVIFANVAKLNIGYASGELMIPCGAEDAELNRAIQLLSAHR